MTSEKYLNGTPTGLIPKMGEFPVSNSAYYQQLLITDAPVDAENIDKLDEQIDPFAATHVDFAEDLPAVGVLLTFEQGWRLEGVALGELRKSLTLAPGEVTKIATVDWRRTLASRDESSRDQYEAVAADTADASAAVTVQKAVLQETTSGAGFNAGRGSQSEGSVNAGGFIWGVSHSSSTNSHLGFSAAAGTGSRNAAAEAAAKISRKTAQHAQASRSTRATQIREVTETESQSTSTRVIANYNHAHALTMQYYEVLQIYKLTTTVVRADRCVFVPVEPLDFTAETLTNSTDRQIELLRRTVRELGLIELDELIGEFHQNSPGHSEKLEAAAGRRTKLTEKISASQLALSEANSRRDVELAKFRALHAELQGVASDEQSVSGVLAEAKRLLAEASAQVSRMTSEIANAKAELQSTNDIITKVEAIKQQQHRLFGMLEKQKLLLNQQMWMRIDPHTWHGLLVDTTFPSATDLSRSTLSPIDSDQIAGSIESSEPGGGEPAPPVTTDHEYAGQPIGGLINPEPIGVFGNYVAFIWDFPREANASAVAFERRYVDDPTSAAAKTTTTTQIALPTEGIFAEAVLGQANAAEQIDLTRFWNWQDSPIPILPPELSPVSADSRARDVILPKAMEFEKAIAALQNAKAEDLNDTSKLLETLRNTVGPDMRSLANAATQAGVDAGRNATEGADRASQRALEVGQNQLDAVVGLANSEVVKQVGGAVSGGLGGGGGGSGSKSGGLSSLGGLLNQASTDSGSDSGGLTGIANKVASKIPSKGGA